MHRLTSAELPSLNSKNVSTREVPQPPSFTLILTQNLKVQEADSTLNVKLETNSRTAVERDCLQFSNRLQFGIS